VIGKAAVELGVNDAKRLESEGEAGDATAQDVVERKRIVSVV